MKMILAPFAGGAALFAMLAAAPAARADPLTAARGTQRLLVVSAPRPDDPLLRRQREVFAAMRVGAAERDLVLVEVVGGDASAQGIHSRLALDPDRYQAVLVGKDGGAKLRSDRILGPAELFPLIDAMPMRQEEMRHRPPA